MDYTKDELRELAAKVREATGRCYWIMMQTGVHTFIEFNGLMSKYADVLQKCADQGIQFPLASTHTGNALPVAEHDLEYLAEKLDCIFGPIIRCNPRAKRVFAKALLEIDL